MMKQLVNVLMKFVALSVIALASAVGSTQGQSLAYKLRATIPFDFVVGGKSLPAGEYSVGRAQGSGDTVLLISSADGRANAIRLSRPVVSGFMNSKGKLVFHRYGEQYFLSQVWPAGASTGRELAKSRRERELMANSSDQKMARNAQAVEKVNIVADMQ